ncbi:MAG: helix-turn-helix transcriptional regulator [Dactylosporangium sp.]|nr:helix-turn-helix transcriptional regulator [Dactylosporangium sp.]NNJ61188.1 helix-turn-helix transcriptional regulator [Dactylosporangium sp.]
MSGETFGQALRRLRQERGLSLRSLQAIARYDFTYLGQVERGEKPGSLELATTCDRALGLGGELIKSYRRSAMPLAGLTDGEDEMRRRTAMKALAVAPLAVAPFALAVENGDDTAGEVARLESNAQIYRSLYHSANSPADLLGLTRNHLASTVDVLRSASSGSRRLRVLRNRSEIGMLAGRLAFFDLHDPTAARGYYGLAYEAATQAGEHALASAALGHLAFVPASEGNVTAAAAYLGGAVEHADSTGTPILRSWIAAIEAELLASADPEASLRALDQAEDMLGHPSQAAVPNWFDYYSADRLAGFRGYTLLKLGRAEQARTALSTALAGLAPTAVKQRAVFLTDVASTYLNGNADVERACSLATDGVANLALAGYATAKDRLRAFRMQLRPWEHMSAVRSFDERLATLTA